MHRCQWKTANAVKETSHGNLPLDKQLLIMQYTFLPPCSLHPSQSE